MKNVILSIILTLISLISYSQELSGTYTDGESQITFKDSLVEFSFCVDVDTLHSFSEAFIIGKGTYFKIDNYLIIDTEEEDKKEQFFSISESENNTSFANV